MPQPPDSRVWDCLLCGFSYDPSVGMAEYGIPPGTPWEAMPADWMCPECGCGKEEFEPGAG